MRHRSWLMLVLLMLFPLSIQANQVEDLSQTIRVFQDAEATAPFFATAYGYAVFPTIGQGAVGIGGAYGKGQVYRNGEVTGMASMVQLSIGFQLGGKAFSEMIFFENEQAYQAFTRGSFEFDASASAVAITAGAQAKASTSGTTAGVSAGPKTGRQFGANYVRGMAIFIHTKGGLMYEAAVGGQKFSFTPL